MKKVIAVLVLFVGLNAMAQKRENRNLNPEQIATLTTKKMTLDLDLNESQQSKIYELQLENAKSRMTKMEAHRKENSESMKKLSSEERFAKKTEMLDHQIAQKKKIKTILNADQFEKWEKLNHNRKNRFHKKRGERKHNMKKENKE
ncbi:hypothetical protein [Cellulophaga tyrosinoxydans]|uniref:LTXXQ motif family protein n=1 Tax=Cellulophaga tyrosinoxydans TaxID=504486 RepID=A0A1W1ZFH4_9FLAO|nr:hypothetical protein [Cellulophaga tyrosinoxydans]SMC46831.1 hypothetical protein SAMN05660703_1415 [Cellulophaga tyrosinoxydans]